MLKVSATEVKENFAKYLALASSQDIFITKNGKLVAKLTNVSGGGVSLTDSLIGVIPDPNVDMNKLRKERLAKNENID